VTLATPPFRKKFSGVMSGLSLGACVPNLKFVSLVTLELLAFNAQKFKGSRDPGHAPFYPLLTFRGWRPPSDIVSTRNRYNRSTDNASEVFQHSHQKCIMYRCQFRGKWGKKNRGYPYWILTPNERVLSHQVPEMSVPNFIKIG